MFVASSFFDHFLSAGKRTGVTFVSYRKGYNFTNTYISRIFIQNHLRIPFNNRAILSFVIKSNNKTRKEEKNGSSNPTPLRRKTLDAVFQ